MKRDLYIDYVKGIATLCIIFIHTVFWSGQLYVPREWRIFSLFFDVPIFFALSGFTSSGNIEKTFRRLLKLQITYMIFVTLLFVVASVMDPVKDFKWANLGNWYVHQYSQCQSFKVVMGSFWYLKTYFCVMILSVLILRFFANYVPYFIGLLIGLTLLFNFYTYPSGQVGYVSYYLCVFLIANQLKGKKIISIFIPFLYVGIVLSFVFVFSYYGGDIIYFINKQKFPPKIPYITISLFSLVSVMVLYNRLRISADNFLCYIGRDAIFYYFAQGVSSSLVYYIVEPLAGTSHWVFLMMGVFIVNVILAIIIAFGLKKYDQWAWSGLRKVKSLLPIIK